MPNVDNGLITVPSTHSVDEVVSKVTGILQAKSIKLFALIDHSGEAAKEGLQMRPTKLLIFGDPKVGTPLMQASPQCAIDLPLKILVWEDDAGKAQVTYNSAEYLGWRHQLPESLLQNIAVISGLAEHAAQ